MSRTRIHDMTLIFGGMTLTTVLILLNHCPVADAITAGLVLTVVLVLMDMRGDHNGTEDHTR